jgi:hypothetical protein
MKTPLLLLALLALPAVALAQQPDPPEGALVASAQVSGFELRKLSPGLQDEIGRLAGGPLNREQLKELAARIEAEQPRFVAAVRVVRAPDDEVRVVFVVAHMRDQDRDGNVNARYLVESVELEGFSEADLSADVRAELQGLVGKPLGSDDVQQLEDKLRAELVDHDVRRRVTRGSRSGEIRLTFLVNKLESARWLRFTPLKSKLVYHSDQGWGAFLDFSAGTRDFRFTPIVAIDNNDDLVEEYSGFGLRFESRKLGTERLGASIEWTSFEQDWRDPTLAALAANPQIPAPYEDRSTITPLVSFAITKQISVTGGVSISELEPLAVLPPADAVPGSHAANAAVFAVGFRNDWQRTGNHEVAASFGVRAATDALESDVEYTRYFAETEYEYRWAKHTVIAWGMAGGIDGTAPLFERFTLGDSRTLRGWDKYDIAPAGGDRMFHASLEYRFHALAFFLDTGSVWDHESDARVRVASGLGVHAGPFFMTVGFPLNTDDVRAVFTTGVRFGAIGATRH